jgi:hypothetical protein
MSDARIRRLDWGRRALQAYVSSLVHIAGESRQTALLVEARVDRALSLIVAHPGIGTPGPRRNERIFPIPNTGHVIHYRVFVRLIRITHWYRARRETRR